MDSLVMATLDDPRHEEFLNWLLTPRRMREPSTLEAMADKLGVAPRTLRDWKLRDDLRLEWKVRSRKIASDPDLVAEVVEELRLAALDPNARDRVPAARLFFQVNGEIEKGPEEKPAERRLAELSDDELKALLAEAAQHEIARRGGRG
jgi:hypothetical protein